MKLYFAVSVLLYFYVPAIIAGQVLPSDLASELSTECKGIREKLEKNMAILETAADSAQAIQQKDCNLAKSSSRLTKKYSRCLPSEAQENMQNVNKNMRFVSKIICENVNKRILGCFSPENLKQFNKCTNKTIQYMDFMAKQKKTDQANLKDKPQTRKKRFLQDLFSGIQGRRSGRYNSDSLAGGNLPGFSLLQSGLSTLQSSASVLTSKKSLKSGKISGTTSFEENCCMAQLHSDCFLNKVLHTCAEKSELRLYKAVQTVLGLAVRDVVDIACGKIETLDQCEKFSNEYDANEDLGFRR